MNELRLVYRLSNKAQQIWQDYSTRLKHLMLTDYQERERARDRERERERERERGR